MSEQPPTSARAYAYHVPLNPDERHGDEWSTYVSVRRVRVGDRLDIGSREVVQRPGSPPEVVIGASSQEWEVVEIEHGDDDGRQAGVGGLKGKAAVWDGTLVLRKVE
jgi:hypothetical protein